MTKDRVVIRKARKIKKWDCLNLKVGAASRAHPPTEIPKSQPTLYVIAETSRPIASIRAPLRSGPRAVKIESTAPTLNKAQKLSNPLAIQAFVPEVNR